jgi:hypothetical protein
MLSTNVKRNTPKHTHTIHEMSTNTSFYPFATGAAGETTMPPPPPLQQQQQQQPMYYQQPQVMFAIPPKPAGPQVPDTCGTKTSNVALLFMMFPLVCFMSVSG